MDHGTYTQRLLQKIAEFTLDRHDDIAQIKFAIEQGWLGDDFARQYLVHIEPRIKDAIDHPNCLPRTPTQEELCANGPLDIEVGSLVDAPDVRFGLRFRDRPRSVLVAGNQGSGKTTLILNIIERVFAGHDCSLFICDKKLDYPHLAERERSAFLRLSTDDEGCHLGLNAPEGCKPRAWISLLASCFAARSGMIAAWTCFANMIRWLLAVLNPKPTKHLRWPSLRLILQVALASPAQTWGSKRAYEETLIGALDAITQATPVFDCFSGFLVDDLIRSKKHVLWEMPNVSPAWVRAFMQDVVFCQALYGRIYRHEKTDGTSLVFILDEADQDATAESDKQFPDGLSPLSLVLRMGREYGLMAVVGLGRTCHAGPYILSEPLYHFFFAQSDSLSAWAAQQTLMLPSPAMFPALQPGVCIARESQGAWTHPMLVQIDYQPPGRGPMSRSYDTHPFIPSQDLDELPEVQQALDELKVSKRNTKRRRDRRWGDRLSEHAHRLLHTAAVSLWAPAATLWKRSGQIPDARTQKAVRQELEDTDLCDSEEVRIGRANVLLYEITPAGWDYLQLDPPKRVGRGSIGHRHVCHWIASCGEMDAYRATCEWTAPGTNHPVDCAWELQRGAFHAFEVIVTSTGNLLHHLSVLSTCAVVRQVTVVCLQKREIRDLQQMLATEPVIQPLRQRLNWDVADTYLRRCFP